MAHFSITIPDDIAEVIALLAEDTGRSRSSICSQLVQDGIWIEIERREKYYDYKERLDKFKRKSQK